MTTLQQPFTKKLFLFSLLATTSLSFAKLSENAISDCYENQLEGAAKYLEYYLVFKPNNEIQAASMNFSVKLGAAAATILLATKTPILKDMVNKDSGANNNIDITALISSGVICSAASYAYHCHLEKSIKRSTLINFLNHWSHHRQFLPSEFTTAFDELAADLENVKTLTDDQVAEIFELVQHFIEHSFEKRYPKAQKKGDLLSSLKTVTEIGKNIGSAK